MPGSKLAAKTTSKVVEAATQPCMLLEASIIDEIFGRLMLSGQGIDYITIIVVIILSKSGKYPQQIAKTHHLK